MIRFLPTKIYSLAIPGIVYCAIIIKLKSGTKWAGGHFHILLDYIRWINDIFGSIPGRLAQMVRVLA